jgi:hypothetical protein
MARNTHGRELAQKNHPLVLAAAHVSGLTVGVLVGPQTGAVMSAARFAAFLAGNMAGMSSPKIGRIFARDHSSILHGIGRAHELGLRDKAEAIRDFMAAEIQRREKRLNAWADKREAQKPKPKPSQRPALHRPVWADDATIAAKRAEYIALRG